MIGEVQSVIGMLAKSGRTMMIVTHEMDFAKKIANRVLFMDGGGIYDDGTPKQIFDNPQKEKTKRFIHRLSTLQYRITDPDFDFEPIVDDLQGYAEKLLIENSRISKLQLALEGMVMNNLLRITDEPEIYVKVDYSEKKDLLSMEILYKGEHFDPKESENILFKSILEEPTTYYEDEASGQFAYECNNRIYFEFRWVEE